MRWTYRNKHVQQSEGGDSVLQSRSDLRSGPQAPTAHGHCSPTVSTAYMRVCCEAHAVNQQWNWLAAVSRRPRSQASCQQARFLQRCVYNHTSRRCCLCRNTDACMLQPCKSHVFMHEHCFFSSSHICRKVKYSVQGSISAAPSKQCQRMPTNSTA